MAKSCSTGRNRGTETSVGIGCADLAQRVEIDLGDGDTRRLDAERLSPVGSQLAENADLIVRSR